MRWWNRVEKDPRRIGKHWRCAIGVIGTVWILSYGFGAQEGWFPFVIPGDDASRTATDFSWLSSEPAGADGFVRVRNGRFYTEHHRLRIWGVNLCFGANFPPTHEIAEKVAAHLAKLGINGVRMHHHDSASAPRGIWDGYRNGRRLLDPQQLDRQDYWIAQLIRHGIYINLNLHVGRTFTEKEGFVSRNLPRAARYDKYILYFDPWMRERFKEFCRAYLTHYNPYRHRRRVEDPGIAMVEITNEDPFSRRGPELALQLPEPYRSEFRALWNRWLKKRYKTTVALEQAWRRGMEPLGQPVLESTAWKRSLGAWRVIRSKVYPVEVEAGRRGPQPGRAALRLRPVEKAPKPYQQGLQRTGIPLQRSHTYTLSFWARADQPRSMVVEVSIEGPRQRRAVKARRTVTLLPSWQHYVLVFSVGSTDGTSGRIDFRFGGDVTPLELAGVVLRPGNGAIVVPEGQSLEKGNLGIPTRSWCQAAQADVRAFMVQTEKEFLLDMMDFLKHEVGVRVPITGTQITYTDPQIVAETCDYADVHYYWQHPRFPGRPWDSRNWYIPNTPMEAQPERSLLIRAPWRLLDRPYTLSEWNIPAPNDYGAGMAPFAALIAGLQDWDGVFFFQYHSSERDWYTDQIQRYFALNGHPVKLALLSALAPAFRRGDITPLREVAAGTADQMLSPLLAFRYRIGVDPKRKVPSKVSVPQSRILRTPDGQAIWDASDPRRAYVKLVTPRTCAVWGLIANREFDLGGIHVAVGSVDRDYAVVVLTSLDGRDLAHAHRILLVAAGRAENQGMQWNAQRTSVDNHWGHGPTIVNGVSLTVRFPFGVRSVAALDGRGAPTQAVPVEPEGEGCRITVGSVFRTLWYAVRK